MLRRAVFLPICELIAVGVIALAPVVAAAADAERGKKLFAQCKRCHQIGEGAENRIGPHLNDIIGRAAGSFENYMYSPAMRAVGRNGIIWDEATLDTFLAEPYAMVPRTSMTYAGMKDPARRTDIIAWLQVFSGSETALPEAEPTVNLEQYGLDPAILTVQGDPAYGAYLASQCTTCHQMSGVAEGIPSIIGWPTEEFMIALHAYKIGKRPNEAMQLVARQLSDEAIAALAAHFSTLEYDQ